MSMVAPPRTRALVALVVAAGVVSAGVVVAGCSFLVESNDRQCESDTDCAGLDDAVCDVAGGVCVPRSTSSTTTSTGTAGCVGPDGCYACPPEKYEEFLNACTEAQCIPYDNTQLEGLLLEDGSVPPVP